MKISIIIPVYNRTNELQMVLESLAHQTLSFDCFEACIADDGSAEDVQGLVNEFLRKHPGLQLKYARQEDDGYRVAAARNLGVDMAVGEIIVYSDNGMILRSNTLEKHIEWHKKYGENLVALCNMRATGWGSDVKRILEIIETSDSYDKAMDVMREEGINDGRVGYLFEKLGYDIDSWYVPWLSLWSGHFSVNANFVKKNGIRWNELFNSWGCEDTEYGVQLHENGGSFHFCDDVEVIHYPTPDSKAVTLSAFEEEETKKNHERMRELIISLHPDNHRVQVWGEMRGSANFDDEREKFFKEKGWA